MKKLPFFLGMILAMVVYAAAQQEPPPKKPVYYYNPSWSPDGRQILFESTRDGKYAIYVMNTDGTNLRKLTSGAADDEQPRWSRDGRQIVFISNRDGHSQLYLMKADGSGQRRLTNGPDEDYIPDFSPKGDQVVFSTENETFVIRTDGTGRTRLPVSGDNVRWSPNGKKILFAKTDSIPKEIAAELPKMSREERLKVIAKRDNSTEIFLINKDGANLQKLTDNSVRDFGAEWSKDGQTIYFLSNRDGSINIYAMNGDGSGVRQIADGNIVKETHISPDGKYFVYSKQINGKYGVYIYDIKTGTERLVVGE